MKHRSGSDLGGRKPLAPRVLTVLIAVIMGLVFVHLLLQYLNLNVYHELNGQVFEISNRVDFDDEVSVPTWYSQLILLAIAVASWIAAYLQKNRFARQLWVIIGVIGVAMSLDEGASIHEFVLQTVHLLFFQEAAPTVSSNAWLILLPFVGVIAALLLWFMWQHIPKRTIGWFIVGGTIFMLGAVFIDILTNSSGANNFYEKGLLVAIEESFELLGSSVILCGIIDYLQRFHGPEIRSALKQLRS